MGWLPLLAALLGAACAGASEGEGRATSAVRLSAVPELSLGGNPSRAAYLPLDGEYHFTRGTSGYLAQFYSVVPSSHRVTLIARMDLNTNLLDQPALELTSDLTQTAVQGITGEFGGRWAVAYGDLNGTVGATLLATFAQTGAAPTITRAPAPIPYGAAGVAGCDASGCLYVSGNSAQRFDASGAAVGAPIAHGDALGGPAARATSVATQRDQWVISWSGTNPTTRVADVYMARVARDGTPRDGLGVLYSTVGSTRITPAIATDGTHVLAVFRVDVGSGSRLPGLYAHLVDVSSGISAGPPITISLGADVTLPSVTWDGSRYWVAWQRSGHNVQYLRVSATGALLDATPFEGGAAPPPALSVYTASWPYIASAPGNGAVISWVTGGYITVQALRADGAPAAAPHIVSHLADTWAVPSAASDGTSFVVGCSQVDPLARAPTEARFFVVRPDGSNTAGGSYAGTSPLALVWDGSSYRGLRANATTTVSAAGAPSTPTSLTLPTGYTFPGNAVVLRGVTYMALAGTPGGVLRLDASGRQIDPYPIAVGDNYGAALATDGTVVMAHWGTSSARISDAGDVLDATPWSWAFAPVPYIYSHVIAYGGGVWAVAIANETRGWLLQKASAADPVRVTTLEGCATVYGVTWNGREFVVVGSLAPARARPPLAVWSVAAGAAGGTSPALSLGTSWDTYPSLDRSPPRIASTRDGTTAVVYSRFDNSYNAYRCAVRLLSPDGDAGTLDAATDSTVDATAADVVTDTGPRDVTTDTGVSDTGRPDVATDTSPADVTIDAGVLDAVVSDATTGDAEVSTDGSDATATDATDAGDVALIDASPDAGSDASTTTPPVNDGCSTQCGVGLPSQRSDGKGAAALGFALVLARRTRRKRG